MSTTSKYLKDESGNVISPITNINSIFNDSGTSLLNIFYPVGSYYETSNSSFNPNTSWGGTWVQDTKGQVMAAQSSSGTFATLGANVGSDTHTMTIQEMPAHTHPVTTWSQYSWSDRPTGTKISNTIDYADGQSCNTSTNSTGGGNAFSIIQNTKVCIRWHRTA